MSDLNNFGKLYRLGGVSASGFGRCRSPNASATMDDGFQNRIRLIEDNGGFPAEGFGFDLNGFAGAPGPRFGSRSGCGSPQTDPVMIALPGMFSFAGVNTAGTRFAHASNVPRNAPRSSASSLFTRIHVPSTIGRKPSTSPAGRATASPVAIHSPNIEA